MNNQSMPINICYWISHIVNEPSSINVEDWIFCSLLSYPFCAFNIYIIYYNKQLKKKICRKKNTKGVSNLNKCSKITANRWPMKSLSIKRLIKKDSLLIIYQILKSHKKYNCLWINSLFINRSRTHQYHGLQALYFTKTCNLFY